MKWQRICQIWLAWSTLIILVHFSNSKSHIPKFIIGGLFPVHSREPGENPCEVLLKEKGIQRLEAMYYAIDQINKEAKEWGFLLEALARDTCSSDSYVLEQSLDFLKMGCGSEKKRVVGVVGAANSPVSETVASICRLFKLPQVSYGSTSEELDNTHKYPYFFRVVPSDRFQIQVIYDILTAFRWSFVSAVIAEGEYGEKAIQNLQDLIRNSTFQEICFATIEVLRRDSSPKDYERVIRNLKEYQKARAVVVFLNEDKVRELLAASKRLKVSKDRFLWLASDGWGAKTHPVMNQEHIAEGAITIMPKRFPIQTDFDEYFINLKPETNKRNHWFREFWECQFDCAYNRSHVITDKKNCTGKENIGDSYRQEGLVAMVVDSVYVIAHALKKLCENEPIVCKNWDYQPKGKKLKEYIQKISFNSSQGNYMKIDFSSDQHIPVNYTIYQFQKDEKNKYDYKAIFEWNPVSRLHLLRKPVWGNKHEKSGYPESSCSKICTKGEERVQNREVHTCCWDCRECEGNQYIPHSYARCTPCKDTEVPSKDRTSCIALEEEYLGKNWNSVWALFPIVFAILGLVCTAFVSTIFILYHKTPIIMASGRELCYIILIGCVACFTFTFIAMAKPTPVSCGMVRVGMGFGLSICYAAIFTKTNRISRIFNRSLRTIKRPSYISPGSQVTICLCLILIQVTLTVMWLIIKPPSIKLQRMESPRALVVMCGMDSTAVILGLLYNFILILLCTVYAFKTRNIPENFNESKYISFTMYASCIVWLAFIPTHFSTWKDYKVQSILCMSVSISAWVALACLFFPKIYIVLFKPERNIRYPNSAIHSEVSSTCGPSPPVRFLRPPNTSTSLSLSPSTPKKIGSNDIFFSSKNSTSDFDLKN